MDKKTFLEELRKSLRVLKDEEIEDIIGEYEQHIDLKVKNGLTVEQAIADFGNVKELAAEILEGYHVKAEFEFSEEDTAPKSGFLLSGQKRVKCFIKKLWSMIGTVWSWLINRILWCGKQVMRPFNWIYMKWTGRKKQLETSAPKECSGRLNEWFVHKMKGVRAMILRIWDWMIRVCLLGLRICWNCFVAGTALTIGGFGLICLFAVGVLVVLWVQGYPIIGVTIGCLGLVVCLFAAAVFVWMLIWHSPKENVNKDEHKEIAVPNLMEMEEGQHA